METKALKLQTRSTPIGRELHYHQTGWTQIVWVRKIEKLPFEGGEDYTKFYEVVTIEKRPVMYLASGYKHATEFKYQKNEIVPFYRNGKMASGCGMTFIGAFKYGIEAAIHYTY